MPSWPGWLGPFDLVGQLGCLCPVGLASLVRSASGPVDPFDLVGQLGSLCPVSLVGLVRLT